MATKAQIAHTEDIVLRLYHKGTSKEDVEQIAEHLRLLQLSPAAWQVANHLLKSSEPNVRFFAANTFTIKLNSEGASLPKDDVAAILEKLLEAFLSAVTSTDVVHVTQKLCVALAALFFLPNFSWDNCVRRMLCCLYVGHVVPDASLDAQVASEDIKLGKRQLSAMLLFTTTLAEDAQKVEHSAQRNSHVNGRVKSTIPDTLCLMRQALSRITSTPHATEDDALELLDCYQAWASYAVAELKNDPELLDGFKIMLGSLLGMLVDIRTFVPTAVFLKDILGNQDYTGLLLDDHAQQLRELLFSPTAEQHMLNLANGSQERNDVAFGELGFAFGFHAVDVGILDHDPADPLLTLLHHLTRIIRYEAFDESLGDSAIDFWECYNSHLQELDNVRGIGPSHKHWMRAIEELCGAIRVPFDGHQLESIDRDDPFNEFRVRILDVINDAYDTVGPANLDQLTRLIQDIEVPDSIHGLPVHNNPSTDSFWSILWSRLQPFEGMYDTVVEYRCFDGTVDLLRTIFTSKAFDFLLTNLDFVPTSLQKSAVSIVGEYSKFIGCNLELMFKALNVLVPRMSSSWWVARSVSQLCEQNRSRLTDRLGDFMTILQQATSPPASAKAAAFLLKAVAAIVQALPNNKAKVPPLTALVKCVKDQYEQSLKISPTSNLEIEASGSEMPSISAMEALRDIATAMLRPDDTPITLDDDDGQSPVDMSFWTLGQGQVVQQDALTFTAQIFNSQNMNGELLATICDFLSQGFRERSPGPFVFEPEALVSFLCSVPKRNPRLDSSIQMATRLASSSLWKQVPRVEQSRSLYEWIYDVIGTYRSPSSDPDIAHRIVEFLERMVAIEWQRLLEWPEHVLELYFLYALETLQLSEPLPKAAAAKFWTTFMGLKANSDEAKLRTIQSSVGAALTKVLVDQIGGYAARSDLLPLTDTLKTIVFGRLEAKGWLDSALSHHDFPSAKATITDKRTFIAQVISLQGSRRTLRVVQDFYATCRGTPASYR